MDRLRDGLKRVESFLDEWGRGAWIAAFVLGFMLFWPLGLAILAYTLWSGRMGSGKMSCWNRRRRGNGHRSTGNSAFDDYRAETLRRLEEEQTEFESFLERLRQAKDKAQFDDFMAERRGAGRNGDPQAA